MNKNERDLDFRKLSPAATAVSATGLGLVGKGCSEINTVHGVVQIGIGRGLDGLDGIVARSLHQESDAGALVDAGFDKLGIGAISLAAWQQDAIPKPVISGVFAKNLLSAGLTYIHGTRHPDQSFRPTKWGKASMAADSVAYAAYLTANALAHESPEFVKAHDIARGIGRAATAAGIATGAVSLMQYYRRTFIEPETDQQLALE